MIACMLFVMSWIPEGSFKIPEVSTLPLWVNLENIHDNNTTNKDGGSVHNRSFYSSPNSSNKVIRTRQGTAQDETIQYSSPNNSNKVVRSRQGTSFDDGMMLNGNNLVTRKVANSLYDEDGTTVIFTDYFEDDGVTPKLVKTHQTRMRFFTAVDENFLTN